MGTPTVIVSRHGSTQNEDSLGTAGGKIGGWLDYPLDEAGRREAVKLAKSLKQFTIDRIVSSDLRRALDTAVEIQRQQKSHPVLNVSHSLRTWNLADLAGQEVSKVKDQINQLVSKTHTPAPGKGETFSEFSGRVIRFLNTVLGYVERTGQTVCLATHGRVTRIIQVMIETGEKGLTPRNINGSHSGLETGEAFLITKSGKNWKIDKVKN